MELSESVSTDAEDAVLESCLHVDEAEPDLELSEVTYVRTL